MPATPNRLISLKWSGKPQHRSVVHCKCATAFSPLASGRQVIMFASTTLKVTSLENLLKMSRLNGSSPSSTDVFYIFLYLPACHPFFVVARRIWNALPLPTIWAFLRARGKNSKNRPWITNQRYDHTTSSFESPCPCSFQLRRIQEQQTSHHRRIPVAL